MISYQGQRVWKTKIGACGRKDCSLHLMCGDPYNCGATMIPSPGYLSKDKVYSASDPMVTLGAELAALRESALDLSRVPEGWEFNLLSFTPQYAPERSWQAVISRIKPVGHSNGTGPTPRAALDAAIARANEHGEAK